MIFELIIGVFVLIAKAIAAVFGSLPAPGWISSFGSAWGSIVGLGAGLDAWVPWSLFVTVATTLLSLYAVSFAIKVVRIILSLFTGGGGSAA